MVALAALMAALATPAQARMTVLYDVVGAVNAMTGPAPDATHLNGVADGIYRQLPATSATYLDPQHEANKVSSKAGFPSTPTIIGLGSADMASVFRSQINASTSRITYLDEIGTSLRSTGDSLTDAQNFAQAITTLAGESYTRPAAECPGGDCATNRARRIQAYVRFPQSFFRFPQNWTDAWSAMPKLGGVWLELYTGSVSPFTPWSQEQWVAWARRFKREFITRGGDPARLHVLLTANPALVTQRTQWTYATTGAGCGLLANGPGGYRLSNDASGGSSNTTDPADFVSEFRAAFGTPVGGAIAPMPPDLAPTPPATCWPAHRFSGALPSASSSALAGVLALPRTGTTLPQPPSATQIPVGQATTVSVVLTSGTSGTTGIAERVTADTTGFWSNANATLSASGAGVSASAPVGSSGVATLSLTPTQTGPISLTLNSLDGAAVRATTQADGRLLDIPLSVRCATERQLQPFPEPLENPAQGCVDALNPADTGTLDQVVFNPTTWTLQNIKLGPPGGSASDPALAAIQPAPVPISAPAPEAQAAPTLTTLTTPMALTLRGAQPVKLKMFNGKVKPSVQCRGSAAANCVMTMQLRYWMAATATKKGYWKVIGSLRASVPSGWTGTRTVALTAYGKNLVKSKVSVVAQLRMAPRDGATGRTTTGRVRIVAS